MPNSPYETTAIGCFISANFPHLGDMYTTLTMSIIVDAHLDLAYNAGNGRDVTTRAAEQPANNDGVATVGLPDLRDGGVGAVCATIFCEPSFNGSPGYTTSDAARTAALGQLRWYEKQIAEGRMRCVREPADLPSHSSSPGPLAAILLMEGADPLRTPGDVPVWFAAGLRIVGLAWKATRYAGGTGMPGPITPAGREMVPELDRAGILHDVSHLAEESFWQLLELTNRPVLASHSNCRAIVPTDRQLSDEMIRAVTDRGGVIGINFYEKFLLPPEEFGKRRSTLADVVRHIDHICQFVGNARHVAIGTDMDGGFGREQIPQEIRTSADLPRVGDALATAGYSAGDVEGILGGNWLRYFRENLPAASAPTSHY
jgi:membrane dipeptidase